MTDHQVVLVPCSDYEEETVSRALESVLAPIGGLDFVKPGMKIAIKANLVTFMKPEEAATTHPALLCALTKMLIGRGATVVIGDSPGGLYNSAFVNRVYHVSGMKAVEAVGATLNQNFGQSDAEYPEAAVAKTFRYTAYLDDADAIIDFCKLKSHGMMGMSAAAKNMFGVIPGTMKPEYHYRFPNAADFARMIVDLDEYFKPSLSIVDAVVGMEGNGPTAGKPRQIGAIVAGKNPHAVDLLCADLIGLSVGQVPTLGAAIERGLIPEKVEELDVIGDPAPFRIPDFDTRATTNHILFGANAKTPFGKMWSGFCRRALTNRPKLKSSLCVGCGMCAGLCPAKAIVMENKRPMIDRDKCIKCFCCQEFCPKGAMQVHRTLIARIANH